MIKYVACLAVFLLVACGASPAPPSVAEITAAIGATNVHEGRVSDTPVPQSYTTHAAFEVAGKSGQVFICDTKKNCDAIYAYFDALKALAGPYLYQSPSGVVVVQLNSGIAPEDAKKVEQAVQGF